MGATGPEPLERIGARVPPDVFETLHRAALLTGTTLNGFLVQAALKEAQSVIKREETLRLSRRDAERLLDLLENPPPPNAALAAAQARYRGLKRDADNGFIPVASGFSVFCFEFLVYKSVFY